MLDFAGYLISFSLGYFICKKKSDIKCFFNSMKFLYNFSKQKNIYNDFFEANFKESDYVKEGGSFDE